MFGTNTATRGLSKNFCLQSLMLALLISIAVPPTVFAKQNGAESSAHLYFFTNHGCAPCRQVEPGIQALAKEGYPVSTIYLNDEPQMAQQFNVNRTPTVILVSNNKMVGRHAGLIDGVTLKQWFAAIGIKSGNVFRNQNGGTKVQLEDTKDKKPAKRFAERGSFANQIKRTNRDSLPSTLHKGTRKPADKIESRAMQATVRLKVEDPDGISYATGTVIHGHAGEYLVMTCGHVFRESAGKGEITAEYGFGNGKLLTAPGELISYDAKARDIALVAIKTNQQITPVPMAIKETSVKRTDEIFTIGCDHGDAPTIRRSQIKNRAAYDGAIKYDIYGRPVDGRSGGGLFNAAGELIGVCNAAAVEVDEGIYTALETLHWQLAKVNLEHLFESDAQNRDDSQMARVDSVGLNRMAGNKLAGNKLAGNKLAGNKLAGNRIRGMAQMNAPKQNTASNLAANPAPNSNRNVAPNDAISRPNQTQLTPVSWNRNRSQATDSEMEVIILVRSKSDPRETEAITITEPSGQLLDYLGDMQNQGPQTRQIDVAELRKRIDYNELQRR